MTTKYMSSVTGAGGTGTGLSKANAFTTMALAVAGMVAGDDLYIDKTDAATITTTGQTYTIPGTPAAPSRLFVVDFAGSTPPVAADEAVAATNLFSTSNTNAHIILKGHFYAKGLKFTAGTVGNAWVVFGDLNSADITLVNCAFASTANVTGQRLVLGGQPVANQSRYGRFTLNNTSMKFGHAGGGVLITGDVLWRNSIPIDPAGTIPTVFIVGSGTFQQPFRFRGDGLDLSSFASGKTLVADQPTSCYLLFANCRLGASVTKVATITTPGMVVDFINCASGAQNFINERYSFQGNETTETTIVKAGGANDGQTAFSRKVTTYASNANRHAPFDLMEFSQYIPSPGTYTFTFPLVSDGVTLTDADVWVTAQALTNAGYPLGAAVTTAPASLLTAGANLASDAGSVWTTTGLASPVQQKLVLAAVPIAMAGDIRFQFRVSRPSTTVYIDVEALVN